MSADPLTYVREHNPYRAALITVVDDGEPPFFRDLTTGEPCPRRGPLLCTITDRDHLHKAIHMDTPVADEGRAGA